MASVNITIDTENLVPVNGQYTFTTKFLNATTNTPLNDPRFPQDQVHTTNVVSSNYEFSVNIADGNYSVENVKLRVIYKNIIKDYIIPTTPVNCLSDCTIFPIISVTQVSNTQFNVVLTNGGTATVAWKVFSNTTQVANGVANIVTNSFNILTPSLPTGNYILELVGTSCKGKSTKSFNVTNTLPPCTQGPTLLSIISSSSTSLKFQFDGLGVFGIAWRIKQGTSVLRNGVVSPTNSTPTIEYAALTDGTYTLEIEGSTCSSTPTQASFTLSGSVEPLAFLPSYPKVTGTTDNYTLDVRINKSGAYNTTVLRTNSGQYYQNGNYTYIANGAGLVINSLPTGTYIIKVGTLETTVVISNSGGSPCTQGPTLMNIVSATPTGLSFLFDGQNITAIKWRIKQGGTLLRNNVVFPTNNTPFITYNELPIGDYTLEIEGDNCSSIVSSDDFTISPVPTGNNAGVIVTNVGSKYIGIINARKFKATANPTTGAIRLTYDEFSQADGSNKQVKGWLLGSQQQEIKPSDVAELRSANGKILPDGDYQFYLYYFPTENVTTFDQIKNNIGLVNGPQWGQNSKVLEVVIIEIKTNPTL